MCAGAACSPGSTPWCSAQPTRRPGALGSLYHLGADPRLNHEVAVGRGVRADECAALLAEFFAARR